MYAFNIICTLINELFISLIRWYFATNEMETTRIFYYSIGNCALLSFNFVFRFVCRKCERESMLMVFLYKYILLSHSTKQNKKLHSWKLVTKSSLEWNEMSKWEFHRSAKIHTHTNTHSQSGLICGRKIDCTNTILLISNGNVCAERFKLQCETLHAWNMDADEHAAFILILWRRRGEV